MSFLHFLARTEGKYNIWILSDMQPVWFCLHCPGWIISNHTIIGVCWGHRQAVSDVFSVLQLLRRFSTDLNKIEHGQTFGVREHRRGVGISKFRTVAMEIWKCGLWGSVWPRRTMILDSTPLKISIKWTHKFCDHLRIFHFLPVSMETVNRGLWGADEWKLWWANVKISVIICFMFSLYKHARFD